MLGQTDLPTRQPATHGRGSVYWLESHPVSPPSLLTDDDADVPEPVCWWYCRLGAIACQ